MYAKPVFFVIVCTFDMWQTKKVPSQKTPPGNNIQFCGETNVTPSNELVRLVYLTTAQVITGSGPISLTYTTI